MNKIHIYCMPGLGASSKIFEKLSVPEPEFELHFLNWFEPKKNQSLDSYIAILSEQIKHENPVLLGVSFGGIIVQELAKRIKTQKIIIISSVRTHKEFPKKMQWAQRLILYRFFPTRWIDQIIGALHKGSSKKNQYRIDLFNQYMSVRSPVYLDWAFKNILNWKQDAVDADVIQIHGDKDEIFPIQYIKQAIVIKGGTHAMILTKYKWFNTHLPNLITT